MKKINVGDIVIVWSEGVRGMIVSQRDEIIPQTGIWQESEDYKMRTVYRVAGAAYRDRWFDSSELDVWSARLQ
jgi:hypothetical protein